jgi:hypothetical protein
MRQVGSQKHYRANAAVPIFEKLRAVVLINFSMADLLSTALASFWQEQEVVFVDSSEAKAPNMQAAISI